MKIARFFAESLALAFRCPEAVTANQGDNNRSVQIL